MMGSIDLLILVSEELLARFEAEKTKHPDEAMIGKTLLENVRRCSCSLRTEQCWFLDELNRGSFSLRRSRRWERIKRTACTSAASRRRSSDSRRRTTRWSRSSMCVEQARSACRMDGWIEH